MSDRKQVATAWLTIGQAAQRLSVHPSTLRRWAENGDIPYSLTPGGHRRFASADVAAFEAARRRIRRPGDVGETWAKTALSVTRQSLAAPPDARWLNESEDSRDEHRDLGRQLVGLTMQFISSEDDDMSFIEEARNFGRRYAHMALRSQLPLADALRASIFFRDMMVETALQLPDTIRLRPEANLRLLRKINRLLNSVHFAIAETYESLDHHDLLRD